jgi:hypothetical protein
METSSQNPALHANGQVAVKPCLARCCDMDHPPARFQ